ncbi:TetR/AcrR family transcriptional regulator [Cupriavidus sp. BIS7]|uniref:TetR/AcrR family transcriptional regulator n=1 Tax=Cupriavidus sp. BIS7 TaxID=1217718 RepID=UPI0002E11839|nr:TetR/AcrR family transcriptional regulator [Cupriavidus sp. BIS7]
MTASTPTDPDQTAPARQRRPGRPTARTTDAGQRDRLIDAAVTLFARHGVGATSTKAIATEAGVTPALVHYYFHDREMLLDAVFDERLQPLVEQVFRDIATAPAGDVVANIPALAGRFIRTAAATPWFPGLWIREIVGTDGQLRERLLHRVALRRASLVMEPLEAARAQGKLTPGLEPALVMVSLVGLALLPLATTHIWHNLPGAGQIDTESLVRHVTALLAHGLFAGDLTPDK